MGEYYRDADQLYEIYGYFMERILTDDKIGAKMAKANIIIKFIYTDPDTEITIDLKNPPEKTGVLRQLLSGPHRPEGRRLVQAKRRPFPPLLARF